MNKIKLISYSQISLLVNTLLNDFGIADKNHRRKVISHVIEIWPETEVEIIESARAAIRQIEMEESVEATIS